MHHHAQRFAPAAPMVGVSAVLALGLVACGPEESRPGTAATDPATAAGGTEVPGTSAQIERRIGDATVRAYTIQTSMIPESVASEQGIERSPDVVMLRVSGRTDGGGAVGAVPLQVEANVSDLHGSTEALNMREVETHGLIDYVGTVKRAPPDTLRFDIRVTTPDGSSDAMQLERELVAR